MRRALALTATLLALAPAAAFGQDPEEEEFDDEPVPAATAPPGCERGPGTDADYAYCPDPCAVAQGDDGDYAYEDCLYSNTGTPSRAPKPRRTAAPAAAVQPLATQQALPMTGQETWLIAGFGAGFLLAGAGLRLRVRA